MKAILAAILLTISFSANSALVTISGFTFNDDGPNLLEGQLIEWGDTFWEDGSVQGNNVTAYNLDNEATAGTWIEDQNGTEIAVQGFTSRSETPGMTISFVSQNGFYFPDTVDEYQADNPWAGDVLMSGTLTGSTFTIVSGTLAEYFSGGTFNWNSELAQVDVSEPGETPQYETGYLNNNWTLTMTATPSAVPVPAAVWLFGSGLLGMIAIARRRK